MKIGVDVAATLTANVGFIVTGSIVPPKIDKLVCWPPNDIPHFLTSV